VLPLFEKERLFKLTFSPELAQNVWFISNQKEQEQKNGKPKEKQKYTPKHTSVAAARG
jgi:hypothetical protein